jgi:hypothetical protein
LFALTTQGVSSSHFPVHMYYNHSWFTSSIVLHSTLVLFLW